jgi:hypothetical protein
MINALNTAAFLSSPSRPHYPFGVDLIDTMLRQMRERRAAERAAQIATGAAVPTTKRAIRELDDEEQVLAYLAELDETA